MTFHRSLRRFFIEPPHLIIASVALAGIGLHLILRYFHAQDLQRDLPLYFSVSFGGIPLVLSVARRIAHREFGSDVLAAISMIAASAMGQWLVAAILVLMLSGGGSIEEIISGHAADVLRALAKRMPQKAHVKKDGTLYDAVLSELKIGDTIDVFPHELCPVDGLVLEGQGWMDESYLTGEPFLLPKAKGSTVLSGAINGDRALTIQATKLPSDSRYAQIMKIMEESTQRRPRIRRLGDQLAAWYVPLVLATGAATWAITGSSMRFLAVIVTATPCPLLIAIPVAVMGAVSSAAKTGIIIRDPKILEQISRCRTAIFDKTGTLTYGRPAVTEIIRLDGASEEEILRDAAALERYSRHPLAGAVLDAAKTRRIDIPTASEIHEPPGGGIEGNVDGRRIQLMGRTQAERAGFSVPPGLEGLESVAFVGGKPAALFRFRDAPQPESRPFVAHLPRLHQFQKVLLLSGDRESEVRYLAKAVGINDVKAQCTPEEKVDIVTEETLRAPTLFVGDGINDAPALMRATAGVALGTSNEIASASAGAVVLNSSIGKVDELLHIGRRMRAIALESAILGMALGFIAMLAAAGGHLSPVEGAIVQEFIDLAAVLNAARTALPGRRTDY